MPRNGSGTYTRTNGVNSGSTTWQLDRDQGAKILASRHDTHDQDIADAMTASIAKDGQTTPTANLPMGGFKHTSVADATARNQYAAAGQIQDNELVWCGASTGSSSAYAITASPTIAALVTGMRLSFNANHTNTGASTLAVNGISAVNIKLRDGTTDPVAGDIVSGDVYEVLYDGTAFILLNPSTISGQAIVVNDNAFTIQDQGDPAKRLQFEVSGVTTGNTRTMTVPDASGTITLNAATQTLTNKSIDAANNTITNIPGTALASSVADNSTLEVASNSIRMKDGGTTVAKLAAGFTLPVANGGTGATDAATARTNLGFDSGTYTPTLTNSTNVAASTAFVCRYFRIGDIVTVSGQVNIDPTNAAATVTLLGISLPIASNLANTEQLSGTSGCPNIAQSGAVYADTTNDRAILSFPAANNSNAAHAFVFTYQVLT